MRNQDREEPAKGIGFRYTLFEIIFEADTPLGKMFDIALLVVILLSVLAVMLESVSQISLAYGELLTAFEWIFTGLFTLEYILRIYSIRRPWNYIFSFFGVIDLLAIAPTYLSLLFSGTHVLAVIRVFRLLRIFRIFKLARYLSEASMLLRALRASRPKITVFLFFVLTLVVIVGSLMYLIEGPEHGFTSIPTSIYWAIVTLTTVGYGDITPMTMLGKFLAGLVMIMGYGIIAVPTGIVSVELGKVSSKVHLNTQACDACGRDGHDDHAVYCKFCGYKLEKPTACG